ncbi:hypothetical protein ULG90_16480 [Halopseudomonas pachastrellae]|nr:hypothetical protein ULG90_16480 [Halopseudomonas pachastrellae]
MDDLWPNQTVVPEFQRIMLDFEYRAWRLGMDVLSCFAERLGFARDFFTKAHDRSLPDYRAPCACCTICRCRKTTWTPACGAPVRTPTLTA